MIRAPSPFTLAAGVAWCALLVAWIPGYLAGRARAPAYRRALQLGRNWSGLVMGVREGHELVRSGPYAIVRHPIYTGLILAMVGTA